jgi:uncharacterized membrane protein YgdD (TMEM256/DUF423 family)
MGHRLIVAVFFFQTVPDRQAVAHVPIAQVIPLGGFLFLCGYPLLFFSFQIRRKNRLHHHRFPGC